MARSKNSRSVSAKLDLEYGVRNMSKDNTMLKRRGFIAAAATLPLFTAGPSIAQGFPSRPIRVIIPFPPGGIYFPLLKVVTDAAAGELKTSFVLEHRPGAGTTLGTASLAKADPDGYTLGVLGHVQALNVEYFRIKNFDLQRDFANIAPLVEMPTVLVTHPNAPFKTLVDMVKFAVANKGRLNYGAATSHPMDLLALTGNFDFTNVPYKGQPEALGDLVEGRIDLSVGPLTNLLPLIRSGKVLALAVLGGKRSEALPGTPAVVEVFPTYGDSSVWVTLAAPKRLPDAVLKQLRTAFASALSQESVRKDLVSLGFDPGFSSASDQEVTARIASERERARVVLAKTGRYSN
jgi:tripartite-type tricarboxylate transporter receptor subunit TctC